MISKIQSGLSNAVLASVAAIGSMNSGSGGVAIRLDLVVGPAGLDRLWEVLRVPRVHGGFVAFLDEQPRLAVLAIPRARAHDRETTLELLAVKAKLELAVRDGPAGVGGFGVRLPRTPVPDDHVARPVLAPRNDALEIQVLDRVVFDLHGQPPLPWVERRAFGHGPADEDAVDLESEVVVQSGGAMALDDEASARSAGRAAFRLGRLAEVALALVLPKRHRGYARTSGPVAHPPGLGASLRTGTLPDAIRRSCGAELLRTSTATSPAT